MSTSLITVRANRDFHVATWDRVLLEVIFSAVTSDGLRARLEAHRQLSLRFPGEVLSLTVMRRGAKLPEMDVRTEAARVVRELAPKTRAIAITLEGEGFWASAARSALTAIQMVSGGTAGEMKVSASVNDAARYLAYSSGQTAAWAQQLVKVVQSIEASES